jgi:hypothetical protein
VEDQAKQLALFQNEQGGGHQYTEVLHRPNPMQHKIPLNSLANPFLPPGGGRNFFGEATAFTQCSARRRTDPRSCACFACDIGGNRPQPSRQMAAAVVDTEGKSLLSGSQRRAPSASWWLGLITGVLATFALLAVIISRLTLSVSPAVASATCGGDATN